MQNIADAEFVLHEDRRVERNLIPIGQGVAAFNAQCSLLSVSPKCFDRVFDCDAESIRETDFDFLSKAVVGAIEAKGIALVNQSGEDRARRQDISVGEI